jgi:phosphate acyltransferase
MGATWAARISKNPRPRVGLLTSGGETGRGPRVVAAAHDLYLSNTGLNFIGSIEATDIHRGIADVVVCAGHVGSLYMKMLDAIPDTMLGLARYASKERLLWRGVLAILQSGMTRLKQLTDWQEYGAAPLLGHDHLCMKAHRRSGARTIANAIKVLGVAAPTGILREMESRVAEFQTKRTTLAS